MIKTNKGKLFIVAFALSLLLNAFLIGFVIAPKGEHHRMHDPKKRLHIAAKALPDDVQDNILKILDTHHVDIQKAMKQGKDNMDHIRSVLTADKLDLEKLDTLFQPMADHHVKVSKELGAMFKELALALPDDAQRKAFFETAMRKPPKGHFDHDKHAHGPRK